MTFQERAIQAIQASGGRVTHQRLILLDILADARDDIDAEHLHQRALLQDPSISLPTVYRTLHTLENAQLITPTYVSQEHERKVYRVNGDALRFHFTCRECGKVIPFQTALIQPIQDELMQRLGAEVTSFCMCVGGLCADCRAKLSK